MRQKWRPMEKKVQKQNEKMLKLMERIDLALERIDELEDLAETRDRRIRNLEEKVEELEGKACWCKGKEREVVTPVEVKRGHRMGFGNILILFFLGILWSGIRGSQS